MKKCPECGKIVHETNSKYCPECSAKIVSVVAEDILEIQLKELVEENGDSILNDIDTCEKLMKDLKYQFLKKEDELNYWNKKNFLIKAMKAHLPKEFLSLKEKYPKEEIIETLKDKLLVFHKTLHEDSAHWTIATWVYALEEKGKNDGGTIFDLIEEEGYSSIKKNKNYSEFNLQHGIIDKSVCIIFDPQLEGAKRFSEGLAAVKMKNKWGYINKDGKYVIKSKYDGALDFSEGVAVVSVGGKWIFIDKNGEPVVRSLFNSASSFSEGMACVDKDGKECYVNRDFEIIATPQIDHKWEGRGRSFSENMCVVAKGRTFGYIDKEGCFCIEPKYRRAGDFSEGLAPVVPPKLPVKLWGYINNVDRYVILPHYLDARGFSEKCAAVKSAKNRKWGFIDSEGDFVIDPVFEDALDFSEGLAAVKHSGGEYAGKWGFIDKAGKYRIRPLFPNVGSFSEGLAPVMIGNKWGYISNPLKNDSYTNDKS